LLASVAAEINRGLQNLAVPNVEKPHIYRGGGTKLLGLGLFRLQSMTS